MFGSLDQAMIHAPRLPAMQAAIHTLPVAVPLLLLAAVVWPSLHSFWTFSDAYSHGYLVLAIAGGLAVREYQRTAVSLGRPSVIGSALLLVCLTLLLAGQASSVLLLQQLALPAMVWAAVWSTTGWKNAKRFVIPTAYILFAIPVWDILNEPLRALTTVVVAQLTYLSSIPAHIEDNTIWIPSGAFEIEGGCSGLRYLIIALALTGLYGILIYQYWRDRLKLMALAAGLAVVANWVRVFVIIVAGYLTEMKHYFVTVDHSVFGWVLFSLVILPVLFFAQRSESSGGGVAETSREWAALETGAGGIWPTALILWAGAVFSLNLVWRPVPESNCCQIIVPSLLNGWEKQRSWDGDDAPIYMNADASDGAHYALNGDELALYVAHYSVQSQEREVVYFSNRPEGALARSVTEHRGAVPLQSGDRVSFLELNVVDSGGSHRLIRYGYIVGGISAVDALSAKFYQALAALARRWDAQVWVLSAECEVSSCERARNLLGTFIQAAPPTNWVSKIVESSGNGY